MSITTISAPASISAIVRSKPASPTVLAAATLSRPRSSLQALGFNTACSRSFNVSKPVNLPVLSVTSNFSIRRAAINCFASRGSAGSCRIARFSVDIIAETGVLGSVAKRISRLVTIPTTPPPCTTGNPVTRYRSCKAFASARVCSGVRVTGL